MKTNDEYTKEDVYRAVRLGIEVSKKDWKEEVLNPYRSKWRRLFPRLAEFDNFCDPILSYLLRKPCFNIILFSKRLDKLYHWDKDGVSLSDFIQTKFGEEAHNLIKELIGVK